MQASRDRLKENPKSRIGALLPPLDLYPYGKFQAPPETQIETYLHMVSGLLFLAGGYRYGQCGDQVVLTCQQLLGVLVFLSPMEVRKCPTDQWPPRLLQGLGPERSLPYTALPSALPCLSLS